MLYQASLVKLAYISMQFGEGELYGCRYQQKVFVEEESQEGKGEWDEEPGGGGTPLLQENRHRQVKEHSR